MYVYRGKLNKAVNKYNTNKTTKTIKRTYTTKSGKKVTKTYTYETKKVSGYGETGDRKLITKAGNTTKAYDEMKATIMSSDELNTSQKRQLIRQLDKRIEIARHEGIIYYENTFLSHMQGLEFDEDTGSLIETKKNRLRYIYNMGGDPDEIAAELGVTTDELNDENNWHGDTFLPLGITFNFDYDKGITWQ